MTDKLEHKIEQVGIKQTRARPDLIRLKDGAIYKDRKKKFT
jgi:hypothetical protein